MRTITGLDELKNSEGDAHGYYTLPLAPHFTEQIMRLEGFAFVINHGLTASASRRRCRSGTGCG